MRSRFRNGPAAVALLGASLATAAFGGAPTRCSITIASNRAGSAVTSVGDDGVWRLEYEFNDRGRGPRIESTLKLDATGLPIAFHAAGVDYYKVEIAETLVAANGRLSWKNPSEAGEAPAGGGFYLPFHAPPQIGALLAAAALARPDGRLALLPAGELRAERLGRREVVSAAGERLTIESIALVGIGFEPSYLWLAADGSYFAEVSDWFATIREGFESVGPELLAADKERGAVRSRDLSTRLAHRPAGALALTGVRLFDPRAKTASPATTVVVSGNRIVAVGRDGEVAIPAAAERIDANGKTLLPGLFDMHTHVSATDGLLHLAAGVTTVRDLANDMDLLTDLERRWNAGEAIGPRLLKAGFLDGPGPFAGPSKALVSTIDEARVWIDRYAEAGYRQIKLYSSLDPKLVPEIARLAHARGLRVSGHIPEGMTAADAVRAGFDEIQHANFLLLNFLAGRIGDTRTPERFHAIGRLGATIDLASPEVAEFTRLLLDRKTVSDPTLVTFEELFLARPGEIGPTYAPIADRLPATVRRGLLAGGLAPPAGMEDAYREGFRRMQAFVAQLHRAGVPIVAGTDALAGFAFHRELELYVEAGIAPAEVLAIATLGAARVAGVDAERGFVAPGALADLVLVDGDPLTRISDIRRVSWVMKDGVAYSPRALLAALGIAP